MTDRILAIDPGSHAGWAINEDGRILDSGVFECGFSGDIKTPGAQASVVEAWLKTQIVIRDNAPHMVAQETPAGLRGMSAVRVAYLWMTLIQMTAHRARIEWRGVPAMILKKWATGTGRADKPMMMAEAQRRWPDARIVSFDQADACLISEWARTSAKARKE